MASTLARPLMRRPLRTSPSLTSPSLARPITPALKRLATTSTAPAEDVKKTPLYDLHLAHQGKLTPFAGFHLPLQYASLSHKDSHHFTRANASLFDVSHMVQHVFRGPDAAAFLETVTPSGWRAQGVMQGKLTTFLWPKTGGIVDDSVVTRIGEDAYYVVTNGACLDKDTKYFDEELGRFGGSVEWSVLANSGLLALQGPRAAEVLQGVLAKDAGVDLSKLYFGSSAWATLDLGNGAAPRVLISRGGYTGEDGFELSFDGTAQDAFQTTPAAATALLESAGPERLQLAGLAARDSLRLEAGMCLYGHDLDDTVTPVEAGLSWIIPKERRAAGGFHGAEVIGPQLIPRSKGGRGVDRRRVGLVVEGAPAREGAEIHSEGSKVGVVTSGLPSPTVGKNIAMGYVKDGLHKAGTELDVVVRGKKRRATVAKMPFTPARYYKSE